MNKHLTFKVSVRLMAYNHGLFIKEAMQGVMQQKTNFPVEVIIGDDFSQDNTLDIIKEFEETPLIKIRILEREKGDSYWVKRQELGRLYNFTNIIENCSGEYIALLDGDDYWTDPYKLQKQVDFLNNEPSYSACFTNALIKYENDLGNELFIKYSEKFTFGFKDIIRRGGGFFPTATLVFRNSIKVFPPFMYDTKSGDRALAGLLATHGKFYFLNQTTAVYRKHDGGVFTSISQNRKKRLEIDLSNIQLLKNFQKYFPLKYSKALKEIISNYSMRVLSKYPAHMLSTVNIELKKSLQIKDKLRLIKNNYLLK